MRYLLCGPQAEAAHKVLRDQGGPSCEFLLVPKASDSMRALHTDQGGRVLYCDFNPNRVSSLQLCRLQEDLPWNWDLTHKTTIAATWQDAFAVVRVHEMERELGYRPRPRNSRRRRRSA